MVRRRRNVLIVAIAAVAALVAALVLPSAAKQPRSVTVPSSAKPRGTQPAASAAASSRPIVGLISGVSGWGDAAMAARLSEVTTRTGTSWLREGFPWSKIEPARGRFAFAHFDHFMLLAARKHLHVAGLLYNAPSWAAGAPNEVPSNPSAYAEYVAAVVGRYGPHGSLWAGHPRLRPYAVKTYELWSEAYDDIGNNKHYNPVRYAQLVKAATTAARAADSGAKFLIGADMQGQLEGGHWLWWVDALYRAVPDLSNYFDGVAVHPYGPDLTGLAPAIPDQQYNGYDQMRRIEIVRAQFVNHGAAGKPFWASEVGWPTCTTGSVRCVSAARQATSLRTLIHYMQTRWSSYMHVAFVYYYDDTGKNLSDSESQYGLTYFDHRAKPALAAFKQFALGSPAAAW